MLRLAARRSPLPWIVAAVALATSAVDPAGASPAAVRAAATAAVTPAATEPASEGDRAVFVPVSPTRLLDTRVSGPAIPAKGERVLQVSGVAGVPADALAIVVNVTAVTPTTTGYLTVYPTGQPRPTASNLNFVAKQVVANLATVRLGTGGRITVFNALYATTGTTHVVLDLAGYYRGHAHDDRYLPKAQAQARTAENAFTCTGGTVLKSVAADGAPICVTDSDTTYTAGHGLALNGTTFSAEQGRSAQDAFFCASGTYLRAVSATGAPTCATDSGVQFTTGLGLLLSNGVLSAEQRRSAQNAFTCPAGWYLRVVAADGAPTCAQDLDTDTDTTYEPGFGLYLDGNVFAAEQGRSAKDAFFCEEGHYLRAVAADGTPTCAADAVGPTYTAGSGISILGGTISAHQSRTAANAFACPAGQALRVVGADGAPTCAAVPAYTAGPGLALNGTSFGSAYGATVIPVRADATPAENGTLLRNAMAAVTGATEQSPYVLALAPGTYDLGGTPLTMKSSVSVVGAGRGFTTITGARVSQSGGLVNLGNNTTLAGVTVRNMVNAGTSFVTAVMSNGANTARLYDVHGYASQEGGEVFGLLAFAGSNISVENSQFTVINPTAIGTGIYSVSNTTVRARNVEVGHAAPGGWALHAYNASRIEFADGYANGAVRKGTPDAVVHLAHSKVDGAVTGGVQCFGAYTSAMAAATCT